VPKTKVFRLELSENQVRQFHEIRKALGHDEKEQTFGKMLQLIHAAIALTSKDSPRITLYTRDTAKIPDTVITCPHCEKQFYPQARLKSDGFRELVVDLSVSS
jgi:hypothetical protein